MTTRRVAVEGWYISEIPSLDPIHVFWMDSAPSQGYVTIICYGNAWTAYFGAMNGKTIREFFADCDVSYLAGKMEPQSCSKRNRVYLARIVAAVRDSLKVACV